MDKQRSLIPFLFGNPDTTTFEHRIFNIVMLLSFITALVSLICDVFLNGHIIQVSISLAATIIALSIYLYSARSQRYEFLTVPTSIVFLIILVITWFTYFGLNGSTPYYFFIYVIATNIILGKSSRKYNLIITLAVILILLFVEYFFPSLYFKNPYYQRGPDIVSSFFLCLCIMVAMIYMVLNEHRRDKEKLQKALEEIKELRQLLPICSRCKKIRDVGGYWTKLEDYFASHSDIEFTHGLCPECLEKTISDRGKLRITLE